MPQKKVFIRAEANSSIGLGHLIRTTALAGMLRPEFDIAFIVQETPEEIVKKFVPSSFDIIRLPYNGFNSEKELAWYSETGILNGAILVLDGYQYTPSYQEQAKRLAKLVYIDDLVRPDCAADLLINQADFVTEKDYKDHSVGRFCLGPQYALLRQPFLKAAQREEKTIGAITSVFVSFGGADSFNVTQKVVEALMEFRQIEHIHVLSSSANLTIQDWKNKPELEKIHFHENLHAEQVCTLMQQCQLALSPSSSLSLELCCAGLILLTGTTADNQEGYYKSLTSRGAALGIGNWLSATKEDIKKKVREILALSGEKKQRCLHRQRAYIDGRSGERLLAAFKELGV